MESPNIAPQLVLELSPSPPTLPCFELAWDGSFLGTFPATALLRQWMIARDTYYELQLGTRPFICLGSRTKDAFAVIADEFKSLFGLPKRGTHRVQIGPYHYILFYLPDPGFLIWETPVNQLAPDHWLRRDPNFVEALRELLLYREFLAITNTGEATIRIRPHRAGALLISYGETGSTLKKLPTYDFSILGKGVTERWLAEADLLPVILKMVGTPRPELLPELRTRLDEVIMRIDPSYIWYSRIVIDRITRYFTILLYQDPDDSQESRVP